MKTKSALKSVLNSEEPKANFNKQQDAARFELLAPYLAAQKEVIDGWGVLNIAQCAQQNGEGHGCVADGWSLGYLESHFGGCIADDGSKELERDCKAIWNAAL